MSSMEISNLTKEKLSQMFAEGKRFDLRSLTDFRPLSVEFGVSNKAEGSARVRFGKTEVIAGVKLELGEPYPDSLDKGNLSVSGDLLPLASPRFESGPPGFESIELPRLVDRAIRGAEMIDLSKLVIKEGEKVWTVSIDIYPINDDGNLVDAATLAATLALQQTHVPTLDESGRPDYKNLTNKKLPLSDESISLSLSFYKFGNSIVLDPTREEEEACDAKITFGVSLLNGELMINSCQKGGEATFSQEEISKMMDFIPEKFKELNEKLKTYFS